MVELGRVDAGLHFLGALLLLPTPNGSFRPQWMLLSSSSLKEPQATFAH
jgi:hypothetical protein